MRSVITLCLLLLAVAARAQFPYTFTTITSPYVPLGAGSATLTPGFTWNDEDYDIPLSFPVQISGVPTTLLHFYTSNIITGDSGPSGAFLLSASDLADRGLNDGTAVSPIRYIITGAAPARIFKLELVNAGFVEEFNNHLTMDDSVNLQLWLYETTNVAELHYGPSQVTYPEEYSSDIANGIGPGYYSGYSPDSATVFDSLYVLTGDPAAPYIDSVSSESGIPPASLGAWPPNGTVYRFTPKAQAASAVAGPAGAGTSYGCAVWPTITTGVLHVSGALANALGAVYTITAAEGRVWSSGSVTGTQSTIDVHALPAGLYLLHLRSATGTATLKFIRE